MSPSRIPAPPHPAGPHPAGPHSPQATTAAGATLAGCIRYLNYAAGPCASDALHTPADLYDLLGWLHIATGGLPQMTRQITRWLSQQAAAGTLRDDRGHDPAQHASTAAAHLDQAALAATSLTQALQDTQNAIATLASAPPATP